MKYSESTPQYETGFAGDQKAVLLRSFIAPDSNKRFFRLTLNSITFDFFKI